MATDRLNHVLHHVRRVATTASFGDLPDRDLLDRFVTHRDESAFAALVHRHGTMVMSHCKRVLGHTQDAEDACQAVFLVFARKAGSIRKKDSVGSWLYEVAHRVAGALRKKVSRHRGHEILVDHVLRIAPEDFSWREALQLMDEEIQRLPEQYRVPLVLCYLDGKTRDEAALELKWKPATLHGRLERARELLLKRLTVRGVTLPTALLGTLLIAKAGSAALPASMVVSLTKAALDPTSKLISANIAALTERVLQAMFLKKVKTVFAFVLCVSLFAAGIGLVGHVAGHSGANGEETDKAGADKHASAKGKDKPKADKEQLQGKPKQVLEMYVTVRADFYEIDEASYKKLTKSKRLSKEDLEELERIFLDPQKKKQPDAKPPIGLVDKQKLFLPGKEIKIEIGQEGALLSWNKAINCLPSPEQLRKGQKGPQTIQEGVSLLAQLQISWNRRFVRAKFTEKSVELEGVEKVNVALDENGKEAVGEIAFLKETGSSQIRDIPDGGTFWLPLQYRPRALKDNDRWLVAKIVPRIVIEEEERRIRDGEPK